MKKRSSEGDRRLDRHPFSSVTLPGVPVCNGLDQLRDRVSHNRVEEPTRSIWGMYDDEVLET